MLGEPDEAFYAALLDDDPVELYENAPCGYLSTLPDGTIIKANTTFFLWTGYDRAGLVGAKRFQDILRVGDRIFYETHVAPMLRMQGSAREIAVTIHLSDGSELPVLANAVLKQGTDASPEVIRIALFDARERRAYERELLDARRRAEQSEERARALAKTLQETLIPPAMFTIPGVEVAGVYRPAGDGTEVGGDFYDVFEIADGRYATVVGDVAGKGPEAAVVTALARYTIRAETLHAAAPSQVLAALHRTMLRDSPEQFVTAVLSVVTPDRDGAAVAMSVGGHELPVLVSEGTARRVGTPGAILGLLPEPSLSDSEVRLGPGDALVMCTDGVDEARADSGEFFGADRLETLATDLGHRPAGEIAHHIADVVVEFQHGMPRDDIAILVLRIPDRV